MVDTPEVLLGARPRAPAWHLFVPKLFTVPRQGYGVADLRSDVIAGLTVAIVALPLAMALAIASGTTPDKGLLTAVVAGFLISALGGSRFQIGGPTGAFVLAAPMLAVRQLYKTNWQLQQANQDLLELMVAAIEARDPYTSGHSRRVSRYGFPSGGGLLQGGETVTTWCWRSWRWRLHRLRLAFLLGDTLLGVDGLQLGDDTRGVAVEVDSVHTGLL